jgi:acylphosphatase
MPEPQDLSRLHIRVTGRVQNVGFRAHVEYTARQLGLTGWVRNVGYDTVEAVAEGERQQLERLAEAIKAGPRGSQVNDSTVEWLDATGEFEHFIVGRSA